MRYAARVDGNQSAIVEALRAIDGCSVELLHRVGQGCPDLLVGYRGANLLFEVKDPSKPKADQELTEDQRRWHANWRGQKQVVRSVSEIISTMTGWDRGRAGSENSSIV